MLCSVGCSGTNQGNKGEEKVVTVAIAGDNGISTMDATYCMTDIMHYELIYEPLVVFGENGEIEPGLATEWTISDNGLEYTFNLRKDVKFSDGSDFNADNVIFNSQHWANNANLKSTAVGGNLKEVTKIDDYTVKFIFTKAFYPYLTELSYPRPLRMMSSACLDSSGQFVAPAIGTGMWKIESYVEGEETVLVPNPYYWGEKPKVAKLVIKVIPDAEVRLMALQNAEVDFSAVPISSEQLSTVKSDENLTLLSREDTKGYHIIFNYDVPVFNDINLRKAINFAVNKGSIAADVLDGNATAAEGIFPLTVPYVTEKNSVGYDYDLEKAKALLKDGGYADANGDGILEKDGVALSFKLVLQTEEYPEWKPVCEYLQRELLEIGVDLKLEVQPSTAYYDTLWTTRSFDMIMYRTYSDSWNPHGFLKGMYCKPSGDGVRVAWNDDTLEQMITEVLTITDETARQQQYDKIFNYMNEQAVCVPIYYPISQYAYNKKTIDGVESAVTSYELLKWGLLERVD